MFRDPPEREQLISHLAQFYGCSPRLFRDFAAPTLQRAWRVAQNHQTLTPPSP